MPRHIKFFEISDVKCVECGQSAVEHWLGTLSDHEEAVCGSAIKVWKVICPE